MSVLRTILLGLLAVAPSAAAAVPNETLRAFATCAGRYSATMEYQWLMSDPAADQTEARRAAMLSLIDAIMTRNDGRSVLAWRIDAKQAHAVLLTRSTFNSDEADAAWALRRAEAQLATCTGLLLS